jgi:hypothetical protein
MQYSIKEKGHPLGGLSLLFQTDGRRVPPNINLYELFLVFAASLLFRGFNFLVLAAGIALATSFVVVFLASRLVRATFMSFANELAICIVHAHASRFLGRITTHRIAHRSALFFG